MAGVVGAGSVAAAAARIGALEAWPGRGEASPAGDLAEGAGFGGGSPDAAGLAGGASLLVTAGASISGALEGAAGTAAFAGVGAVAVKVVGVAGAFPGRGIGGFAGAIPVELLAGPGPPAGLADALTGGTLAGATAARRSGAGPGLVGAGCGALFAGVGFDRAGASAGADLPGVFSGAFFAGTAIGLGGDAGLAVLLGGAALVGLEDRAGGLEGPFAGTGFFAAGRDALLAAGLAGVLTLVAFGAGLAGAFLDEDLLERFLALVDLAPEPDDFFLVEPSFFALLWEPIGGLRRTAAAAPGLV